VKALFKDNISFLLPYFIYIVLGSFLLALNTKIDLHLTFNSFHAPFWDSFFAYFTYLGDGVMALLTVIILLTIKYRYALIAGVANLVSAAITQALKLFIYSDSLRPKKFFEGVHDIYLVPGVENHLYNSFPSGHTTCAFALYFSLSLFVKKPVLKSLFFIVALLAGYSRIYLSQHFFEDVYAGSLIGLSTTIVVYYFVRKNEQKWMEGSLVSSFKS
jgi:membrane-associated phospholipid phosphatase